MKTVSLVRDSDGSVVVASLQVTLSVWERTRGLLMRPPLKIGEGLMLQNCTSIHTIGMTRPLDIAFLDRYHVVQKCVPGVRPFRFAACFSAVSTLELPAGGLVHGTIRVGDQLRLLEEAMA